MLQALPVIRTPKVVPRGGTEPVDIWAGVDHPISVHIITSFLGKGVVFHLFRDFSLGRKVLGRLTAVRPANAVGFYCLDHIREGAEENAFGQFGSEIMIAGAMEHLIFEKLGDKRFNLIVPE